MSSVDKALDTQLANIEKKTGKSLDELAKIIGESGLTKHGEMRTMAMEEFALGYGDANTLVHYVRQSVEGKGETTVDDAAAMIYSGKKEELRPLHDEFMKRVEQLDGVEIAPKKTYLSLRRKKQFATVGPGSKGRLEIGLNLDDAKPSSRLEARPAGSMCNYRVYLSEVSEVDNELVKWLRSAYERAG